MLGHRIAKCLVTCDRAVRGAPSEGEDGVTWPRNGTGMTSSMPILPGGQQAHIPGERMAGDTHRGTGESQVSRATGGLPRISTRRWANKKLLWGRCSR